MLPIFSSGYKPRGSISIHPTVGRFRELVKENVKRIQAYYASNVRAVTNDHPFVQVIKHLPIYNEDPVELFNTAYSRYPYLSKNLGFTTEYNKGTLTGHKVYSCSDNMIFATSGYIRPYFAVDNWKSLRPLNNFWSAAKYVDMSVPSNKNLVVDDFNAVTIDIPMLSMMYKGFYESQSDAMVLGVDQFVATHLLPSILESQVDMSCISSLLSIYEGNFISQSRVNAPSYFPSYSAEFHKIATHAINKMDGSRMQYLHMLQSIPTVYHESAADALIIPSYAPTTQVQWAMLVVRLKVINFLLEIGGKAGRDANKGFIQTLKPYCRDIQAKRIPYDVMSDSMAGFVDDSLTHIQKLR